MLGARRRKLGRRIALVIGNADYDLVSDLPNAAIDAINITDKLRELGFVVIFRQDQSYEETLQAVEEFSAEMQLGGTCDIALLYYAGHGVQLNGENFIVPRDFVHGRSSNNPKLYPVQDLMQEMVRCSRRNLIFLDACRDRGGLDPRLIDSEGRPRVEFAGGLSKMALSRDENTFVAYAADPGDVAQDGPLGFGSPFSGAVARHLSARAVDIHDVLQWVANDVREATSGKQRPWSYSNMTDQLHLNPKTWLPFWLLIALGALAGLLNVGLGYDSASLAPVDAQNNPEVLASTLLFALVLGYGVWKWGRGTLWAAFLCVVVYAGLAAFGRYLVGKYAGNPELIASIKGQTDWRALIATAEVRELILVVILAGAIIGFASVASGAVTTRSLRPLSRLSVGVMFGALSAALYLGFLAFRFHLPTWAAGWELAVVYLNAALWQAGLAGNVGWAYTHHVVSRPGT